MTIYEQAFQEGYREGYREGSVAVLAEQLALKFGELPREYIARLQAATIEEIERYVERIFTADSIAAVFATLPAPLSAQTRLSRAGTSTP